MNNKLLPILAVVIIAFIFFYTFSNKQTSDAPPSLGYESRLKNERAEKDKFLKESDQSPIIDKASFKGLNYFEVNSDYKIKANLQRSENQNITFLQTTGQTQDTLQLFGTISFEKSGKKFTAQIFKSVAPKLLFLPFKDATSGKDTYGGGRYLDVSMTNVLGNTIELDFNQAYHPYCAYNKEYICPLPPKSNIFDWAIIAGEKL